MAGRPPNARVGEEATLETIISDPHGFDRLEKQHHKKLDRGARLRARAYLNQARQYYETVESIAPVAKPLTGYYFALNLTKVFLTATDPDTTKPTAMHHGLSQAVQGGTNYSFKREKFRIQANGAFRLLAERTGMRHCWAKDYVIGLSELLPFLPEGFDLFAEGNDQAPDLLPLHSARALFGPGREAWLRIEIEPESLRQRNLRAESLLASAKPFGDRFRLVTTDEPTYSYESKDSYTYGKMRSEVVDDLARLYDSTLIASDRSFPGPRKFLVLSHRPKLLSHEAVAFAVLHHLSNVVRYRPADAERILTTRNAWLLTTWVDRACENLLLNLATRITGQDHVIAS